MRYVELYGTTLGPRRKASVFFGPFTDFNAANTWASKTRSGTRTIGAKVKRSLPEGQHLYPPDADPLSAAMHIFIQGCI